MTGHVLLAALASLALADGLQALNLDMPAGLDDGLEVDSPRSAGLKAAPLDALDQAIVDESFPDTTSVLVLKDGKLVFERYFGVGGIEVLNDTRSAMKSVTAIAVGVALADGALYSVDEAAFDRLEDLAPFAHDGPLKRQITLADLLTMSSSLDCNDWDERSPGNEENMYPLRHWSRWAVDIPVTTDYQRGETGRARFSYCTAGTFLLGQILERAVGEPVDEYINGRLFDPLGISLREWPHSPSGEVMTGGGLRLRSRDLLKLGKLVQSGGRWGERQIVATDWISEMLTVRHRVDGEQQYGYQYWQRQYQSPCGRLDGWSMSGNGGNVIVHFPSQAMVAVVTRQHYNRRGMHEQTVRLLEEHVLAALNCVAPVAASGDALQAVRDYRATHANKILGELRDFLTLPNVASNRDDIERNADHLVALLEQRGIAARTLRVPDAPPAVYGAYDVPGAARTVVFYAHYDGQPAPIEQGWVSDPWMPVLRAGALADGAHELDWAALDGDIDEDWRIYARSASDDKSPIIALLAAFDALLAAGIEPSVNLRFFFEGEEEAGSPHLADILREHRDLLAADLWLFCDGPVHQDGRGQVVFGVRGAIGLEMTLYGPLRALHSGHYGNWAPNPAARLAELIASMRDGEGQILVDGFYDRVRPLGDAGQAALAAVPDADAALRRDLAIGRAEANNARLVERIMLPAINVRGIRAGGVQDEAANAIPTEAHASLDIRLVPDLGPDEVKTLLEAHVRRQGYTIVRDTPEADMRRRHPKLVRINWSSGYPGLRTPLDLPVSRAVVAAVEAARGEAVVRIPNLGGSLPIYLFDEILATPLIIVPMVNHDNNQHAANENLRIGNLWTGIDMYAFVMMRLDW